VILVRNRAGDKLSGPAPLSTAGTRGDVGLGDRLLKAVSALAAALPTAVLLFILGVMLASGLRATRFSGTQIFGTLFSIGNDYLPEIARNGIQAPHGAVFGILPEFLGTLVTSVIALAIGVPVSVGAVLMLSEWIPQGAQRVLSLILDLLAGVPSVVFGLWGVYTLGPFFAAHLWPGLSAVVGGFPWLFPWVPSPVSWIVFAVALAAIAGLRSRVHGAWRRSVLWAGWVVVGLTLVGAISPWFVSATYDSQGILTASVVLSIMIVPIVASTTRELVRRVPVLAREGAFALGMSRHEVARVVTIPYVRRGILATALLGWGRAIGETVAVFLIIGNIYIGIPRSIFASGGTLASLIVGTLDGTLTDPTGTSASALSEVALILLAFSLLTNLGGRLIIRRVSDEALPVGRGV
jgi:phosphate transport system permease protein